MAGIFSEKSLEASVEATVGAQRRMIAARDLINGESLTPLERLGQVFIFKAARDEYLSRVAEVVRARPGTGGTLN